MSRKRACEMTIKPGRESGRIDCEGCNRAFLIYHEPDYAHLSDDDLAKFGWVKAASIKFCPFCGGTHEALRGERSDQ
jgi:hypothetical protein